MYKRVRHKCDDLFCGCLRFFAKSAFPIVVVSTMMLGLAAPSSGLEAAAPVTVKGMADADLNWNFFNPKWTTIPYLGVNGGVVGFEGGGYRDSYGSLGCQGGAKFFLSEDISFNVEGRYQRIFVEDNSGNDNGVNNLMLNLGFSFYWGGK